MKLRHKLAAAFFACVLVFGSFNCASAATGFKYGDYSFHFLEDNSIEITGYDGVQPNVALPDTLFNSKVTSIDAFSFMQSSSLQTIDLSTATELDYIGQNAFLLCSALTEVTVPETVTIVERGAFADCQSLQTVSFNASTEVISTQCFQNCVSLTEFDVPDTVNTIEAFAFAGCTSLGRIYIPRSVTAIDENAFNNTPNKVIYCWLNSYAYNYAVENNIDYVLISNYELGDARRDGALTMMDVTKIQKYLAQMDVFDDEQLMLSDFDGDGVVSISDCTALQRYLAFT